MNTFREEVKLCFHETLQSYSSLFMVHQTVNISKPGRKGLFSGFNLCGRASCYVLGFMQLVIRHGFASCVQGIGLFCLRKKPTDYLYVNNYLKGFSLRYTSWNRLGNNEIDFRGENGQNFRKLF
jgi:hypothetical protein